MTFYDSVSAGGIKKGVSELCCKFQPCCCHTWDNSMGWQTNVCIYGVVVFAAECHCTHFHCTGTKITDGVFQWQWASVTERCSMAGGLWVVWWRSESYPFSYSPFTPSIYLHLNMITQLIGHNSGNNDNISKLSLIYSGAATFTGHSTPPSLWSHLWMVHVYVCVSVCNTQPHIHCISQYMSWFLLKGTF